MCVCDVGVADEAVDGEGISARDITYECFREGSWAICSLAWSSWWLWVSRGLVL